MKIRPFRVLMTLLLALTCAAQGKTTLLEKGRPAQLSKVADDHIFDVYVTPPRATSAYTPGKIEVYLVRMFPDHLIVELIQTPLAHRNIRVHFALQPERESTYYIRVSDLQPSGKRLLLNEDSLAAITIGKPQ
ncbi:MAG TPA: hypothetical protein VH814_12795 [Steroidobacteraceae bacterium]|jgi:hypothetical protein